MKVTTACLGFSASGVSSVLNQGAELRSNTWISSLEGIFWLNVKIKEQDEAGTFSVKPVVIFPVAGTAPAGTEAPTPEGCDTPGGRHHALTPSGKSAKGAGVEVIVAVGAGRVGVGEGCAGVGEAGIGVVVGVAGRDVGLAVKVAEGVGGLVVAAGA